MLAPSLKLYARGPGCDDARRTIEHVSRAQSPRVFLGRAEIRGGVTSSCIMSVTDRTVESYCETSLSRSRSAGFPGILKTGAYNVAAASVRVSWSLE